MKLPLRLETLKNMIVYPYEHVWDCCCDHGYLGRAVLNDQPVGVVHFLDVVEPLVSKVKSELVKSGYHADKWETHCEDLSTLVLPDSVDKQLLIIAGVGGDLTVEFVAAILKNNPHIEIDFLLCPVRQLYKVRVELDKLGLRLVDESIVKDGGRYYEHLHLSTTNGKKLSSVGYQMWDLKQVEHNEYLQLNIQHYQRMARQSDSFASSALSSYLAVKS